MNQFTKATTIFSISNLSDSSYLKNLFDSPKLFSLPGTVFIDGHERTTKLPSLHRGSTLMFDTEVLQSGKVRVSIEVDDRVATFDWSIEKSTSTPVASPMATSLFFAANESKEDVIKLYFAMKFAGDDWKIGVE